MLQVGPNGIAMTAENSKTGSTYVFEGVDLWTHVSGPKSIMLPRVDQRPRHKAENKMDLNFNCIIVDHARRPKEYHTHFIIFLLCVIVFCLAMLIVGVG